jgi:hypothetical protein
MIKKLLRFFKKKDTISFKQAFELTELPIVTFYQGSNKFNFLLDTGSNDNIIDKNILDKVEHTVLEQSSSLYGLEGNKQKVELCEIVLSYKNHNYKYRYLVNDMSTPFGMLKQETGVTLHGIIGSKFFNEFKYVLDFAELIAYSKQ